MTNSSPQEPQNPIPERRKKPAAGVTFDEMIAIVVAFSTIGAILFWSLGGKKGEIASNLGLGGQNGLLSADNQDAKVDRIKINTNANLTEIEPEGSKLKIARNTPEEQSLILAAPQTSNVFPRNQTQSYSLAPLAGVPVSPTTNRSGEVEIEIDKQNPVDAPSQVDVPDEVETPNTPQATVPDEVETPDTPQANVPNEVEVPKDITPSYWAYPFVKQMSDNNLVADYSEEQKFEPNKLITRAGMATLISQAFDNKPNNEKIKQFKDISNQNAIAADVDRAVRMGFMQGYSDNEFRPLENIPRYQVLVTLATGLGLKPSQDADVILQNFSDGSDMPDWAKQQVAAAAEAGLIVNNPDLPSGSLSPQESATRGEVAAMIHQGLVQTGKLQPLESEYIVNP